MTLPRPEEEYQDDFYRFRWPDYGVEMRLERFNERDEDISCELTVLHMDAHMHEGRLLLIGPRSRSDTKRILSERDADIDWGGMLEQACVLSKRRYREGEPAVVLADVDWTAKPRFLLPPYIDQHGTTILFGDGGVSKSTHALAMCVAVATGYPVLGYVPAITGPTVYFDWEADEATHAERLAALCSSLGIPVPRNVIYRRMVASLPESSREARRTISESGAVLGVIDSVGAASGGEPESSEATIKTFNSARALGVPVLLIHHVTKDQKDKTKPFGSVYGPNLARLTWRIDKKQEEGDEEIVVAFTNFKANFGKLQKRHGWRVRYENELRDDGQEYLVGIDFQPAGVSEMPERASGAGQKWQIMEAIQANGGSPMPVKDIADATGIPETAVKTILNREKETYFINLGDRNLGRWALREEREG